MSYRQWRVVSLALNVSAALFAIVAGAALIGQVAPGTTGAVIAGGFGLASALITTASVFIRGDAIAQSHYEAAVKYSALATLYFDLESMVFGSAAETISERLRSLNQKAADLSANSPISELRAKRIVRKQLDENRITFPEEHAPTLNDAKPALQRRLADILDQPDTAVPHTESLSPESGTMRETESAGPRPLKPIPKEP